MAQYLESADKFFYPRKDRFHERYLDDVSALVHSVTLEVVRKQERVKLETFFHSLQYVTTLTTLYRFRVVIVIKDDGFSQIPF